MTTSSHPGRREAMLDAFGRAVDGIPDGVAWHLIAGVAEELPEAVAMDRGDASRIYPPRLA